MRPVIGPFKLYTKKPNAIKHGFLYVTELTLPVPNEKKRTIRVFVPEDYDPKNKYPVIYMSDGQNIVDKYTTAYGEWNIDVRQNQLRKQGYPPFIVVGIDCPKKEENRMLEYSMSLPFVKRVTNRYPVLAKRKPYGDKLIDFIVKELKPLIDKYFSTRKEKEYTAVGGSSMGGIFSMNAWSLYPETFGFCLTFSPAYSLYLKQDFFSEIDKRIQSINSQNKAYIYTGTEGYEHQFLKCSIDMDKYLKKHKIPSTLVLDKEGIHNEKTWSKYFLPAARNWLKKE